MVEPPTEFQTRPQSYYVWSRSRRAGHVLALGLGRFIDTEFRWQTVRDSEQQVSEEEDWVKRLIPAKRLLQPLTSASLRPGPRVTAATFDSLLTTEGRAEERASIEHFLLLPPRLQEFVDEADASGRPRAIVVTNTDRIRQFYPTDPGRLRPFTAVFSRYGLSVIATSVPPPYEGRYGFDVVLRFDVDGDELWSKGQLVVEKGTAAGSFRTGSTLDAKDLPWFHDAGELVERAG